MIAVEKKELPESVATTGRISAARFDNLVDTVRSLAASEPARWAEQSRRNEAPLPFTARIIGWQQIGSVRRWRYAWEEVDVTGDDDALRVRVGTSTASRSGTVSQDYALNLHEVNNVSRGCQGTSIDENRSGYPATFLLQPVGGGAAGVPCNQVVVLLWPLRNTAGAYRPVFEYVNAHDGPCP